MTTAIFGVIGDGDCFIFRKILSMETIGQPTNLFDETGEYPSDDALEYIENFDCLNENPKDLIEFIERIWWAPDWGFKLSEETLELHTGGWSGNESIIASLQLNEFFFTIFWIKSERGGHYYFKLKAGVNFRK